MRRDSWEVSERTRINGTSKSGDRGSYSSKKHVFGLRTSSAANRFEPVGEPPREIWTAYHVHC